MTTDYEGEYQRRYPIDRIDTSNIWHPLHPVHEAVRMQREAAIAGALRTLPPLRDLRIADVGCGDGAIARRLREWGAAPHAVIGLDLLRPRLVAGRQLGGSVAYVEADAARLPVRDGAFDLVIQAVALSSILDADARDRAIGELVRVTAPGGWVLWYDVLRSAPGNIPDGFPGAEVRERFASFKLISKRTVHTRLLYRLANRPTALALAEAIPLRSNGLFLFHRPRTEAP